MFKKLHKFLIEKMGRNFKFLLEIYVVLQTSNLISTHRNQHLILVLLNKMVSKYKLI